MKRRKISQIETEEALKLILSIDRPTDKKAVKKLLTRIVKCEFLSSGHSCQCSNSVFPREVSQAITALMKIWSQDNSIALLLLSLLGKVLRSNCLGEVVADELCKAPNPDLTAIIEAFENENNNQDHELRISVCEVILEILKHDNSAPSLGQSARIKIRGHLLNFISSYRENAKILELSLASAYYVLRGCSTNERQKFSSSKNIEIIVAVCKEHLGGGILFLLHLFSSPLQLSLVFKIYDNLCNLSVQKF